MSPKAAREWLEENLSPWMSPADLDRLDDDVRGWLRESEAPYEQKLALREFYRAQGGVLRKVMRLRLATQLHAKLASPLEVPPARARIIGRAPGALLVWIVSLLGEDNEMRRAVTDQVCGMRQEYFDALRGGGGWRARLVVMRWRLSILWAVAKCLGVWALLGRIIDSLSKP